MLHLDGEHLRHGMAVIALPVAVLVLHQVNAVRVRVAGDVAIEL